MSLGAHGWNVDNVEPRSPLAEGEVAGHSSWWWR